MRNRDNEINAAKAYGVKNPISVTAFIRKHSIGRDKDIKTIRDVIVPEMKKLDGKSAIKISDTMFVDEDKLCAACRKRGILPDKLANGHPADVRQNVESITASIETHVDESMELVRQWFREEMQKIRERIEGQERCICEVRNSLLKMKTNQELTGNEINELLNMFAGLELKVTGVTKINSVTVKEPDENPGN
jgi:hypothetical protein